MDEIIQQLRNTSGAYLYPPINSRDLSEQLRNSGLPLPRSHSNLLSVANGLSVYHGYFRLFGLSPGVNNLFIWNDTEYWKFAWPDHVKDYVCIGETGWGDQYAYRAEELTSREIPQIYFLDALLMKPEIVFKSFDDFMLQEIVRCSIEPYDEHLVRAYQKLGDLPWDKHIAYVPSLLIAGDENTNDIMMIEARSSMILNGDISRQCAGQPASRKVKELQTYIDSSGRTRMRVIWAEE